MGARLRRALSDPRHDTQAPPVPRLDDTQRPESAHPRRVRLTALAVAASTVAIVAVGLSLGRLGGDRDIAPGASPIATEKPSTPAPQGAPPSVVDTAHPSSSTPPTADGPQHVIFVADSRVWESDRQVCDLRLRAVPAPVDESVSPGLSAARALTGTPATESAFNAWDPLMRSNALAVRSVTEQPGSIVVELSGQAGSPAATDYFCDFTDLAVQQMVWTVQFALQSDNPVTFRAAGAPAYIWGQDVAQATPADPAAAPTGIVNDQPQPFAVTLGRCHPEPITLFGVRWASRAPVGTTVATPAGWQGSGVVRLRAPTRLGYVDDSGTSLTYRPETLLPAASCPDD